MKNSKKMMLALVLIMMLALALASCGKEPPSDTGTVGEYDVKIKDAEMLESDGKDVLAVTMEATYHGEGEEKVSFGLEMEAVQGETELDYEPVINDDFTSVDNYVFGTAEEGKTKEFTQTFELEDKKTKVVVTVSNGWRSGDRVLEKTFEF